MTSQRRRNHNPTDAFSMHMIYESETYLAVHIRYATGKPGRGLEDVFEIVDKTRELEVLLQDDLSKMLQKHIARWQDETPDQETVDRVMTGFLSIANLPIWTH